MRTHLLGIVLYMPFLAFACPDLVVTDLRPERYDSLSFALHALASSVLDESASHDVEFAGALYQLTEDEVAVSVGRGCPGHDSITFSAPVLEGRMPTAYWHTHGSDGFARDQFSEDDARLVLATRRPFFLITPRGDVRVLDFAAVVAHRLGPRVVQRRSEVSGFAGRRVHPHAGEEDRFARVR